MKIFLSAECLNEKFIVPLCQDWNQSLDSLLYFEQKRLFHLFGFAGLAALLYEEAVKSWRRHSKFYLFFVLFFCFQNNQKILKLKKNKNFKKISIKLTICIKS